MSQSQRVNTPPYFGPARRHRCEICLHVFECHLCSLGRDHPVHSGARIAGLDDDTTPVFVCEECIVTDNCRYVRVRPSATDTAPDHPSTRYWDYLTGKVLTAADRGIAVSRAERKRRTRKAFLHQ